MTIRKISAIITPLKITTIYMTPDVQKETQTLEEFEQLLTELATSYNASLDRRDERERGIVFDRILALGAEQIATAKDEKEKGEIRAIIDRLQINGPKETLFMHMLGYGLNEATFSLLSSAKETTEAEQEDRFDPERFKEKFIIMIAKTRALKQIAAMEPSIGTNEGDKFYEEIVKTVATLPLAQQRLALEIAEQCFASTEEDSAEGPRALQKAGKRSFIRFYREVRKAMVEKRGHHQES